MACLQLGNKRHSWTQVQWISVICCSPAFTIPEGAGVLPCAPWQEFPISVQHSGGTGHFVCRSAPQVMTPLAKLVSSSTSRPLPLVNAILLLHHLTRGKAGPLFYRSMTSHRYQGSRKKPISLSQSSGIREYGRPMMQTKAIRSSNSSF